MADQKINALPTKTAPVTGDKCLMSGAAEEYLIDYDKLATAILNKLTSKTFTLDQGTKTLIAAINELNSKTLFSPGESIRLSYLSTVGFITNSGKNLYITIPFGKSLENVSGFNISGENLNVRQNGLYVLGNSSIGGNFDDLTILSRVVIKGTGCILIIVSSETPFENAVNNEICSVYFNSGTITFS